jgi:uncharacterized paraquat-inducible protein A
MNSANVYYCWSCDAHRRAVATSDRTAECPRCGQRLTDDSRLPVHGASITAGAAVRIVSAAPIRPRLAASA